MSVNLKTPEDWEAIKETCPGAGNGNFFSLEQIEAQAAASRGAERQC